MGAAWTRATVNPQSGGGSAIAVFGVGGDVGGLRSIRAGDMEWFMTQRRFRLTLSCRQLRIVSH